MENNQKKSYSIEKIGVYVATFGLLFMFWQSWRDITKEIGDIRERIMENTKDIEYIQILEKIISLKN